MSQPRGIPASTIHNVRHYYVAVDISAVNWLEYVLEVVNRQRFSGLLHIINPNTQEEIERRYV